MWQLQNDTCKLGFFFSVHSLHNPALVRWRVDDFDEYKTLTCFLAVKEQRFFFFHHFISISWTRTKNNENIDMVKKSWKKVRIKKKKSWSQFQHLIGEK